MRPDVPRPLTLLASARCAQVGLGEASFCSLASPFIDDAAPAGQKTRWLALFFMCIPVGVGAPSTPHLTPPSLLQKASHLLRCPAAQLRASFWAR